MSVCSTRQFTGPGPACSAMTPIPDLLTKAAALLHSLARNHPLVDGNKRHAWLATYVFLAKNDVVLDPDGRRRVRRSWSPSPRVTSTTSHRSLASWPAHRT